MLTHLHQWSMATLLLGIRRLLRMPDLRGRLLHLPNGVQDPRVRRQRLTCRTTRRGRPQLVVPSLTDPILLIAHLPDTVITDHLQCTVRTCGCDMIETDCRHRPIPWM